jgi:uncharacterized membrane protein YadS
VPGEDHDARSPRAAGVALGSTVRAEIPGVLFCAGTAAAAWYLAQRIGVLSTAAAAIGLGILFGSALPGRARRAPGTRRCAHGLLSVTIALMGLTIPVGVLPPLPALVGLVAVMLVTLSLCGLLGRRLGLGRDTGLLAGMGTAVCGSAAIAASAPVLRSAGIAVAAALASVNLLSALGMLALPVIAHALGAGDAAAGWWAGGSLQAMGQAVGAGFAYSGPAGETATAVKLFRVASLVLWLPLLGLLRGGGRRARLPWFVPGFLLATLLAAWIGAPSGTAVAVHALLAVALAGIGASIDPRELLHQGPRMLLLCSLGMLVQLAGILGILWIGLPFRS